MSLVPPVGLSLRWVRRLVADTSETLMSGVSHLPDTGVLIANRRIKISSRVTETVSVTREPTVTAASADVGCRRRSSLLFSAGLKGVVEGADGLPLEAEPDMCVDAGGDADIGVAEEFLDHDEVDALFVLRHRWLRSRLWTPMTSRKPRRTGTPLHRSRPLQTRRHRPRQGPTRAEQMPISSHT